MLSKPKVLFIQPSSPPSFWGLEYIHAYVGNRCPCPPLGLLTLAGLVPSEYEVELRDENLRPVDYETDADIVAISGSYLHPFHVSRVIELADHFRSAGKLVCIGGSVANLIPDVVRPYCHVLFEGEGELTWPQFLKDFERGEHKATYQQVEMFDMSLAPIPRIDLINTDDYISGMIQTTRGCPFTCEFCDIIVVLGRKVRVKPIPTVLQEVQLWANCGQTTIFFCDDNFVGNRVYAKELLRALAKMNAARKHPVSFSTQASIDTAKDIELMELMRAANFASIYVGIESPRKASLQETLKFQNVHTHDLVEAVHKIQSYGLWVSGGMIVGFDNDDTDIFEEQFQFLQKAGVVRAQLSLLQAVPKTPLYERMKEAGRLLEYKAEPGSNIQPLLMSYDELLSGYAELSERAYSYDAYLERYMTNLKNMGRYKFPGDQAALTRRNVIALLNILRFYCLSKDSVRRRFFMRMVGGTLRVNAHAWRWCIRYLASFIHLQKFAEYRCRVSPVAPATEQLPALAAVASERPEQVAQARAS